MSLRGVPQHGKSWRSKGTGSAWTGRFFVRIAYGCAILVDRRISKIMHPVQADPVSAVSDPVSPLGANRGFRSHELTVIQDLVVENWEFFLERWHACFSGTQ